MNDKKEKEVTLKDLRELGKLGGATALLLDGTEMTLKENYGLIKREGVVFGQRQTVEIIERYVEIYPKIRTIKWNNIVVARRKKQYDKTILELTGTGYKRN